MFNDHVPGRSRVTVISNRTLLPPTAPCQTTFEGLVLQRVRRGATSEACSPQGPLVDVLTEDQSNIHRWAKQTPRFGLMFEIDFEDIHEFGQEGDVVLARAHDEFEDDGFGLHDVGKGLVGDLFLTNRRGRKDTIVVRQAREEQVTFIFGQTSRSARDERMDQQRQQHARTRRIGWGDRHLLHRAKGQVAVFHSMSRLGTSSSTVLHRLHMYRRCLFAAEGSSSQVGHTQCQRPCKPSCVRERFSTSAAVV